MSIDIVCLPCSKRKIKLCVEKEWRNCKRLKNMPKNNPNCIPFFDLITSWAKAVMAKMSEYLTTPQ